MKLPSGCLLFLDQLRRVKQLAGTGTSFVDPLRQFFSLHFCIMMDTPFQVEESLYSFYKATSITSDKGEGQFSLCVSPPPPQRCSLTWCRGDEKLWQLW